MKKRICKVLPLSLTCLLGLGGFVGVSLTTNHSEQVKEVKADEAVSYIARSWENNKVIDTPSECSTYTVVDDSTTSWSDGWYVVSNYAYISSRITVTGTVNLILCDNASLSASNGIGVNPGNTLIIYGQSEDTGSLIASISGSELDAAIGGNENNDNGTVVIHGGKVTATYSNGAGIGGGNHGDGGTITIYGGLVNSTGFSNAAGIGGGNEGAGGTVTIYGGLVNSTGSNNAAGIGGGNEGAGGTVSIYGGNVIAKGGNKGAGIGGGNEGAGGTVTISGGQTKATGGTDAAGIGGGYNGAGANVTITGGKVTANAGSSNAYGIGKGQNGSSQGLLSVNETELVVYGGTTEKPTTIIEKVAGDYERFQYMKIKKVVSTVSYISKSWDSENKVVVDAPMSCTTFEEMEIDTTSLSNGW